MSKYGFINDRDADPNAYVFGAGQIQTDILEPTGDWSPYLPADEVQDLNGVEPYACATFGTFNCVETLLRRIFSDIENFSDRFTAKLSGTQYNLGNSPHTVAECIRKQGAVHESDWPFSPDINTFDKYYADLPASLLKQAGIFPAQWAFAHDWLPNTKPETLKDALRYSPLGISVYAWVPGAKDLYTKPAGVTDNHWVMLYSYEDGVCWHIFDSYDNTHKKLEWNFGFEVGKRYTITKKPLQEELGLFARILQAMLQLVGLKQAATQATAPATTPSAPTPTPEPPQPKSKLLDTFCEAISEYEGGPNDLNHKNNNPGNLRSAATQIGTNHGFAVFKTWDDGMAALKDLITRAAQGKTQSYKPTMDFYQFFAVYSPSTDDGNKPVLYAQYVARRCQVDPGTFPIRNLIV